MKKIFNFKKISKKNKLDLIDINSLKEKLDKATNFKLNDIQLKNLSMAVAAAKLCNLKEKIFNSLKGIKDVSGRLELIKIFPNNVKVFVDFAHTPDALLKVLQILKKSYGQDISLVFGCGGEIEILKKDH